MEDRTDQELWEELMGYGKEAEELIGILDHEDRLDEIRHRCRHLRFAICTSCRQYSAADGLAGTGSRQRDKCIRTLRRILEFPYPQSSRAPRHQLFGWLSHMTYSIEQHDAEE